MAFRFHLFSVLCSSFEITFSGGRVENQNIKILANIWFLIFLERPMAPAHFFPNCKLVAHLNETPFAKTVTLQHPINDPSTCYPHMMVRRRYRFSLRRFDRLGKYPSAAYWLVHVMPYSRNNISGQSKIKYQKSKYRLILRLFDFPRKGTVAGPLLSYS